MKALLCLILISIPMFLQECRGVKKDSDRTPVVATSQHVLYLDEIRAAIPTHLNQEDSVKAAQSYIDNWVKETLVYEAAQENLAESPEIRKMVEDYHKSLMVYEYQEQVLLEKLKTEVSDEEIAQYYEKNAHRFLSSQHLVKGIFIKLPAHSSSTKTIKSLYRKTDEASIEKLDLSCLQNAEIYEVFRSEWMTLDDVMDYIPYNMNDQAKFLKSKDYLEVEDENYAYLLKIDEYILAGNPEPLEFVSNRIKNIIINSHKTAFLRQLENEMKQEAEQKGQITYYQE